VVLFCGQAWADSKKISGTTNVEDAMIQAGGYADNNYGGATEFTISATQYVLIKPKNVASEIGVGATMSACVCSAYCNTEVLGAKLIYAYRVFKPWVEGDEDGVDDDDGDVTYNDWASDEYEWTLPGAGCYNDDGVDNSSDDGACDDAARRDRKQTYESSQSVNATGWFVWSISAELAQDWYDGDANENGILLFTSSNGSSIWNSTEAVSNQPFFVFTYSTEQPPEIDKPRKNIMSGGVIK